MIKYKSNKKLQLITIFFVKKYWKFTLDDFKENNYKIILIMY